MLNLHTKTQKNINISNWGTDNVSIMLFYMSVLFAPDNVRMMKYQYFHWLYDLKLQFYHR